MAQKIIAVDFDGTIVTHMYPEIGMPVNHAFIVLKKLLEQDVKLILWTMRSGARLDEAIQFCADNGVQFWAVNTNPLQGEWTDSPKAYAQLYIDDAALGAPTLFDQTSGRLKMNWREVEVILQRLGYLL